MNFRLPLEALGALGARWPTLRPYRALGLSPVRCGMQFTLVVGMLKFASIEIKKDVTLARWL